MSTETKSREIRSSESYGKTYGTQERARKAALKLCFMWGVNLRFMVVGCNESPRYRLIWFLNEEHYEFVGSLAGAGHQVIA